MQKYQDLCLQVNLKKSIISPKQNLAFDQTTAVNFQHRSQLYIPQR